MTANTVFIGSTWLAKNEIEKPTNLVRFAIESAGTLKLTHKVIQLAEQVGYAVQAPLKELSSQIGTWSKVRSIPLMFGATIESVGSLGALVKKDDGISLSRKSVKAVMNTTGAISLWSGTILSLAKANPIYGTVSSVTGMISTVTELGLVYTDYNKACALAAKVNETERPGVVQAVSNTKKALFYSVVSKVVTIAFPILGLVAVWYTIPAALMSVYGIFSTCLGMYADFLKKSGPYKLIDFDTEVQIGAL